MGKETVDKEKASEYIKTVSERIALLHLSYAKTLTEELGEDKGKELVVEAIKRYGEYIGDARREEIKEKGLPTSPENFSQGECLSIPPFGMHTKIERDGEKMKAYGCVLGRLWKRYGEEELGKLYCYVDAAKYMAYNEDHVQTHTKALSAGDEFCEFEIKPSTEKQKKLFEDDSEDFSKVDEYLEED